MGENRKKILTQIQEKRERMIDSAKKYGYTSEYTIRCSEELDQLIFEYQQQKQNDKKQKRKIKFSFKLLITTWREKLVEAKYQAHS
ncbi:aspartyl-phosphate phosphatase Spo0E family protein [Cytobacillus praedii]|uniref:aspartyl-phosphate phosphatase Spo0E family protein n=1 Tax=Cytobacillus praedii TaxID=1742358 RepID=UPI002E1C8663|nr:aspartyl-phosphate phosphatase Spo0E family protein [Cytobacillus praedii]MED3574475.1 aspartyl-phosphate phosphatase Spo0E family protein [Cytobacillus praedii]